MKKFRFLFLPLSLLVCLFIGAFAGYQKGYVDGNKNFQLNEFLSYFTNATPSGSMVTGFSKDDKLNFMGYWKAWQILEKNYSPSPLRENQENEQSQKIVYSIAGLAHSYFDPFTVFIPAKEAKLFKETIKGEFEGIGAVLNIKDNEVLVQDILKDSPSEKAGLLKNDVILEIDSRVIIDPVIDEVVSRIRGPKGTNVILTVRRASSNLRELVTVTRDTISPPSTSTQVISAVKNAVSEVGKSIISQISPDDEDHIAPVESETKENFTVIKLEKFSETGVEDFANSLKQFKDSGRKGLIIDLRNNPGGYIDVANELASHFLEKDKLVVKERVGSDQKEINHNSKGYGTLSSVEDLKVVVVVNKNSASASEIFAGAMQEYGKAKVVGENTFGKGSVQSLFDVDDLGTLKVTIARWYTPNGKNVDGKGIEPDIKVDINDEKYKQEADPFLAAAISEMNSGK